jgi:hypothetical protein
VTVAGEYMQFRAFQPLQKPINLCFVHGCVFSQFCLEFSMGSSKLGEDLILQHQRPYFLYKRAKNWNF